MTEWLQTLKRALMARRHQYRLVFRSPPGEIVLKDLARFCRAHHSTFHEDPRVHAMLEGRREVWLRIASHLELSPDDLWQLYSRQPSEN